MIRSLAVKAATFSLTLVSAASTAQDNWSYGGSTGPGAWPNVAPTCAGNMQSPILIEGTEPVIMHRLETNYHVAPIALHNDRHTIRQAYASGSALTVGSKVFELQEFRFHTPAEHQIMDQKFPMEIQFLHRSLRGELAVVSVLVKTGKANTAADEILPHLPIEPDQNMNRPDIKINARDLMPDEKSYYRYMGSLTYPPCVEGVNWYVLKRPIEMSSEQIAALRGIMGENARPLQPRNNRILLDAQGQ